MLNEGLAACVYIVDLLNLIAKSLLEDRVDREHLSCVPSMPFHKEKAGIRNENNKLLLRILFFFICYQLCNI